MRFSTYARLFQQGLLILVFGGLTAGCQSARPGFSFQPVSQTVVPAAAAVATTGKVPLASTAAAVAAPMTQRPARIRQRARPTGNMPAGAGTAAVVPAPKARPLPAHRLHFMNRARPQAEAGLGTTVLGVLGLVALPVALIGLALSGGGLVWALVAGAAAVAVLIAWIDPFGR